MTQHIIISSGGTGGHMFPAGAVARDLQHLGYEITLITDKRGMRFAQEFKGMRMIELPVANIRSGGIISRFKNMIFLIKSIFIAAKVIHKFKINTIIGFGGYPSFPSAIAGTLLRKPLFLHEQNAILGRTNNFLKSFARKIFISYDPTIHVKKSNKVIHTGNPVRMQIRDYSDADYPEIIDEFRILVTGGSQGASMFSEVMPKVCNHLPKDIQKKLHIVHQARPEDVSKVKQAYLDANISADVNNFFEDMGQEITNSHLVICRSGASTVTEINIIGRPALYIPLPSSVDDQQIINTQKSVEVGASRMIRQTDFTPAYVAGIITEYYMHPNKLIHAASQAKSLAKVDASLVISNIIQEELQKT